MMCWDQAASYIALDISSQRELDEDTDWMLTLLKSNLFYKIPPMNIRQVLSCFKPVDVNAGEVVVRQGQIGDALYVIKEGEAEVLRAQAPQSASEWVADIQVGRCFGEDALINETFRNATVRMKTAGVLMRLDKHDFYQLLKKPLVQKTGLLQAEKSLESGAQWLDVRTLDEYELAHFNGAIHGQLDLLKLQQRRLDKACEYICYCNTGVRAEAAAYLLSKDGFKVKALQLGFDHLSQDERQRWIENDIIGS
jgi:rhodanese-related sulfurtransferase